MYPYIKLAFAGIMPVAAAAVIYLLDRYTALGKLKYAYKQVLIGIVFGAFAVLGTEFGIPINGALMNVRDGSVLIAGLFFGAPSGIIAGTIGAAERWLAIYWGVGGYTRLACTVSTFIAGIYAALLRKYMFENKKPGAFISLAIGTVMEVLHMTMVFITHMDTPTEAIDVVRKCSYVMIPANAAAVMLAAVVLTLLAREKRADTPEGVRISQTIQRWLLVTVVLAFAATSLFIFRFQTRVASAQTESLLSLAVQETADDIRDASDENLLAVARSVKSELDTMSLSEAAEKYDLAEISIVGPDGVIKESTVDAFIGFDMASGEQSAEFLCLLGDTREYAQDYGLIAFDGKTYRKYAGIKAADGFIQVGYDAEAFQKDVDEEVVDITKNRHVGETGFVLILDEGMNVISAPEELKQQALSADTSMRVDAAPGEFFSTSLSMGECECLYEVSEGYFIFAAMPQEEVLRTRNIALYLNTFMEVLVFAVLFGLIYLLIKKVVVDRIKSINASLGKITGGDLNEVVNVRSNAEFASLSDDINSTVNTLKKYIDEASARIDAELKLAKDIQASALPNIFPAFPKRKDFDIFASMHPAKEVGGDFYDFYFTDSYSLHFVIADVSGKGVPAAMFMMRAMTELKTLTESGKSIGDVFTDSNNALCAGNDAGMFVTAWQGGIDLSTGLVRFANAGHNPPLVKHGDGKFEFLRSRPGFVLAGMEDMQYKAQEVQLAPGDILYLYTDGVTEATNAENELFGEERLLNALNARDFEKTDEICTYIKSEVDAFVGDAPQFDDITMLAFRYFGIPAIRFEKAVLSDIDAVTAFVEKELEKENCPMKTAAQINVAIDELFSNIVRYGYPDTPGPVTVKCIVLDDPKRLYVRFEDEGIPYNPLLKEDPDITLSADDRTIGGLGIFIVKKTMDDMSYKYEDGKNILTIKKFIQ